MDFSVVTNEQLLEYTQSLEYKTVFPLDKLFPKKKVADPIIRMRRLQENGELPVMAKVHGYDTEALIGERLNFEEIRAEAFLIKEKLPLSERAKQMLSRNAGKDEVIDFIFNDADNLVSKNLTRQAVMNAELLATGKVTVKENNVTTVIDYKQPASNTIQISQWDLATTDIVGDIEKVIKLAKSKGYPIVRAITSSTMVGYMLKNNAIRAYWASSVTPLTEKALLAWLLANYGIEFVVVDDMYKTDVHDTKAYRFFDENTISFLPTKEVLGEGICGVTPEQEAMVKNGELYEKSLVTLYKWGENDPMTEWIKGSSVYLPVMKDINGLFIAKHTPSV